MSLSRGQKTNIDIGNHIKSRKTLLWISSTEEFRVERALLEVAATTGYKIRFWDCATEITEFNQEGKLVSVPLPPVDPYTTKPTYGLPVLDFIKSNKDRCIYVLRDLHKWLALNDPRIVRGVKSLSREMQTVPRNESRVMVVLTSASEIPPELKPLPFIDYPLPDREEIAKILKDAVSRQVETMRNEALVWEKGDVGRKISVDPVRAKKLQEKADFLESESEKSFDLAVDAAIGLTAEEAGDCYARSMVAFGKIDPLAILQEKKNIIAQEKVLSWHDPNPAGLDAVGGLDLLKDWLILRKQAFTPEARAKNLPTPKAVLIAGMSGTGKSLSVKCLGAAWGQPILRLDLGAVQSMYLGESQKNLRRAFKIAEAIGKCILWVDELEKALAGGSGPAGDGGVAADQVGALLIWMQEKTAPVFVAATANDIRKLPPELMRKGRFDEVFWVDLPNAKERKEIIKAALREYKQDLGDVDLSSLIAATKEYIGAEIAALVPDAMFKAFADGQRDLTIEDLTDATKGVIPLSRTSAKTLGELREWAEGKTRPASSKEAVEGTDTSDRVVEMD